MTTPALVRVVGPRLGPDSRILDMGVNASFVPRRKVLPLVERRRELRLTEIVRPLVIPVDVYVVEHRRARTGPD